MRFRFLLFSLVVLSSFFWKNEVSLAYLGKQKLKFREPSDLCFDSLGNIWLVSDDGFIVKADSSGKILKRSIQFPFDLETIYYRNHLLYTVDESRNIMHVFDTSFIEQKSYQLAINTTLNRGVEALLYRPDKKCFVCITEKKPVLRELDSAMNTTLMLELNLEGDVSSGMYYQEKIWLLSDENSCVYILNKDTYKLENTIPINILNAEGIASDSKGMIHIVSDDLNTIYKYKYIP